MSVSISPAVTAVTPSALSSALWRAVQPSPAEEASARKRLHGKALVILGLFAISFATFVLSNWPIPVRLAGGVGLVVSLIAVGTGIMHDANHGAFSRHRWLNATLAYSSDALGASSWLWRIQHNTLHHGNTNVVGYDSDLALGPLARLAPSQPWRPWYRAQHVYLWPLYGFLALKNLLVSDVVSLVTKRMEGRPIRRPVTAGVVARVVAGKLFHLGWAVLLPLGFNSWWVVLTAYLVCSWAVGFFLAVTFQLAHCTAQSAFADADAPRRGDDFTLHQLRTTCDVDSSPVLGGVFRWLVGGLDHQIEHHLGPRLPHTAYAAVARRFREQCRVHGVEYHVHAGVWAAVRAHGRWLREMGRRTETADAPGSASWVNEPG